MTSTSWSTVPSVILLALASMCLTIAILQRRSLWAACCALADRLLPPEPETPKPPAKVVNIQDYRIDCMADSPTTLRDYRDFIRREVIVSEAFRRYNDIEIDAKRQRLH